MSLFPRAQPAGEAAKKVPRPAPAATSQKIVLAQAVDELRHAATTLTEFSARLAGQIINDVLQVATGTFDTSGLIALQFQAAAGSIEVCNNSTHTVTVASRGAEAGGVAPAAGIGVYQVAAGATRLVNVASHQITLYGTAGDTISWQVFTKGGLSRPTLNAVIGGGV